ncbi:NAD(+)/NADH kinase, partial [mine drainage metagenome]
DEVGKYLNVKTTSISSIDVDIIITIGGDGTVLLASQKAKGSILGINMGALGFLSEVELGNVETSIYKLLRGDYKVVDVMKLAVYVNGELRGKCINETVIHSKRISKVGNFKIYVDENFIDRTRADGIIIATPLGSTSYSMSAGGPIILPSAEAMVLSFIAPVTLRIRPIVVSTSSRAVIVMAGTKEDSLIILDGQEEIEIHSGDSVEIRKCGEPAKFITMRRNFFTKFREKLLKDVVN